MIQVAVGLETWRRGINKYMLARYHDVAIPEDFYNALQEAVDEDNLANPPNIATIMATWEHQSGYPLITVAREGNQLTLTQERFFYSNLTSDNVWWVPINYVVASNPDFTEAQPDLWMEAERSVTLLSDSAPKGWTEDDWIIVNIQESNYYRVNYDDHSWNLITRQLRGNSFEDIHLLNRAQLIDDSLNLARAGRISYEIPFGILEYLHQEVDYVPWAAVSSVEPLSYISKYFFVIFSGESRNEFA